MSEPRTGDEQLPQHLDASPDAGTLGLATTGGVARPTVEPDRDYGLLATEHEPEHASPPQPVHEPPTPVVALVPEPVPETAPEPSLAKPARAATASRSRARRATAGTAVAATLAPQPDETALPQRAVEPPALPAEPPLVPAVAPPAAPLAPPAAPVAPPAAPVAPPAAPVAPPAAPVAPPAAPAPAPSPASAAPVAPAVPARASAAMAAGEPPAVSGPPPVWATSAAAVAPPNRSMVARLARLHLRGGLLSLARAELEQMAGAGTLDGEALVDLAEARWRGGDLEGAAEAAEAHLATGGSEPLAHVICAEQAERDGRIVDARRHVAAVGAQVGPGLDRLFAGEGRGTSWPVAVTGFMDSGAGQLGRYGLLVGGREVADPDLTTWQAVPLPEGVAMGTGAFAVTGAFATGSFAAVDPLRSVPGPRTPGSLVPTSQGATTAQLVEAGRAAGRHLAAAETDIANGHLTSASDRLALLLRLDPALGPVILSTADYAIASAGQQHAELASLHLLRGDVYRSLGRDVEASAAYQEALRALPARAISEGTT